MRRDTDRYAGERRGGGGLLLLLALILPFGLVVMPTTILMLAALVPTLVAYVVDRDPEKSAPLTVGAMNLCGVMPFAIRLWQDGHTIELTMRMLADPYTWLVMYGGAAIGWLLYFGIPPLVAGAVVMRDGTRIREMEEQRRLLVEEWGPEVAGRTPEADPADLPAETERVRGLLPAPARGT
ncbi:hypothetical protein [Rhodocista pekingensis]|uniref:Acyl-CoA synthetase n=1 Tax=Rhodocista pekingensis TaxID=201185 RepID=A0ABW2KVJ5_9PROT